MGRSLLSIVYIALKGSDTNFVWNLVRSNYAMETTRPSLSLLRRFITGRIGRETLISIRLKRSSKIFAVENFFVFLAFLVDRFVTSGIGGVYCTFTDEDELFFHHFFLLFAVWHGVSKFLEPFLSRPQGTLLYWRCLPKIEVL